MHDPEQITYFAQTDARNKRLTFGIKAKDRTRHMYVIGKTGMGKSTVLENMAAQDIKNGNGFCFIDPHGSAIDTILEYIPEDRKNDVIYFAPFDMEFPVSLNIMEDVGYDKRHLVVSGLMSTFKKIWEDAWSARMEYILSNTLLALLEYPDATLLHVNKMLSDKAFRNKVVKNVTDPSVKSFWEDEFAKYTDRFAAEATPAIQNKIGQFTSNPLIRNILGQAKSSFDLRKAMDERKIFLVNLSKGRIGESNANLLGSMLITKLYLAALSRSEVSKEAMKELPNFYLYVDEFQSFANDSFADILSEARKYKLNLTIAHQYIEQMTEGVRAAVFGNVGTMLTFRVGAYDAEVLEKEFAPIFTMDDIVNLGFAQIYLRLMINGIGSKPFSAKTLPPLETPPDNIMNKVIESSREKYARPRIEVEEVVRKLHADDSSGSDSSEGNSGGRSDKKNRNDSRSDSSKGRGSKNNYENNFQNKGRSRVLNNSQKEKTVISKKDQEILEKQRAEFEKLKEAALHDNVPDGELDSVSLNDLAAKTKSTNDDKKGPKPENKNSLKDALVKAGILGEEAVSSNNPKKSVETEPSSPIAPTAPVESKKNESQNAAPVAPEKTESNRAESRQDAPKATQKQVDEKELKKILGIE